MHEGILKDEVLAEDTDLASAIAKDIDDAGADRAAVIAQYLAYVRETIERQTSTRAAYFVGQYIASGGAIHPDVGHGKMAESTRAIAHMTACAISDAMRDGEYLKTYRTDYVG